MKATVFTDLIAYQRAFELQQNIFRLSKSFPKEEVYSLTDQIRRSSRSVGANIAEAWRKRSYVAHFVSKMTDADAELAETQHWLSMAFACGYITDNDLSILLKVSEETGKLVGDMIHKSDSWCK